MYTFRTSCASGRLQHCSACAVQDIVCAAVLTHITREWAVADTVAQPDVLFSAANCQATASHLNIHANSVWHKFHVFSLPTSQQCILDRKLCGVDCLLLYQTWPLPKVVNARNNASGLCFSCFDDNSSRIPHTIRAPTAQQPQLCDPRHFENTSCMTGSGYKMQESQPQPRSTQRPRVRLKTAIQFQPNGARP